MIHKHTLQVCIFKETQRLDIVFEKFVRNFMKTEWQINTRIGIGLRCKECKQVILIYINQQNNFLDTYSWYL